jgi:hypothetical protein
MTSPAGLCALNERGAREPRHMHVFLWDAGCSLLVRQLRLDSGGCTR